MRRDTAASFFRRQAAAPVGTGHPVLNNALDGGLKTHESMLILGESDAGKSSLALQWAARTLVAGAWVAYVAAPGAAPPDALRLAISLETGFLSASAASNSDDASKASVRYADAVNAAGGQSAVMDAVEAAMRRLVVFSTFDVEGFCGALGSGEGDAIPEALRMAMAAAKPGATPMVIIDGLGDGCPLGVEEKLRGGTVPIRRILDTATVRLHSALVVIERLRRPSPPNTEAREACQSSWTQSCLRAGSTSNAASGVSYGANQSSGGDAMFFDYLARVYAEPMAPPDSTLAEPVKHRRFVAVSRLRCDLEPSKAMLQGATYGVSFVVSDDGVSYTS